jgi:hypothetical protein
MLFLNTASSKKLNFLKILFNKLLCKDLCGRFLLDKSSFNLGKTSLTYQQLNTNEKIQYSFFMYA